VLCCDVPNHDVLGVLCAAGVLQVWCQGLDATLAELRCLTALLSVCLLIEGVLCCGVLCVLQVWCAGGCQC
jgi:hypothetical protein